MRSEKGRARRGFFDKISFGPSTVSTKQMEVKYEFTPDDTVAYSREGQTGTSFHTAQVIMYIGIFLLFIMADILMAVVATFQNDGTITIMSPNILIRFAVGLVILFGSSALLMIIAKRQARRMRQATEMNGVYCEHVIMLDENGFTEVTDVNRHFHSWQSVEKVSETETFLMIHVRLCCAYAIPKRAFPDDRAQREFLKEAQSSVTSVSNV
ncbi:MAG: YcxB family protein [Pyrinomonadaceae bacterium]